MPSYRWRYEQSLICANKWTVETVLKYMTQEKAIREGTTMLFLLLFLASLSCIIGCVKWGLPEGVITPLLSNLYHVSHQLVPFSALSPTLLCFITYFLYHSVTLNPSSVLLPQRSKGTVTPFTPAHAHAHTSSQSCPSRPLQPGGLSLFVGTVE